MNSRKHQVSDKASKLLFSKLSGKRNKLHIGEINDINNKDTSSVELSIRYKPIEEPEVKTDRYGYAETKVSLPSMLNEVIMDVEPPVFARREKTLMESLMSKSIEV